MLFARPEKEREVDDLARYAARTALENYAMERAEVKLQEIIEMVTMFFNLYAIYTVEPYMFII